ncbi:MAG: hypothetical protein AAGF51_14580 [Pseudomonadota bacterium]
MALLIRMSFAQVQNNAMGGKTVDALAGGSMVRLQDLTTDGSSQTAQAVGGGDFVAPTNGFILFLVSGTGDGNGLFAKASDLTASSVAGFPFSAGRHVFSINEGERIAFEGPAA